MDISAVPAAKVRDNFSEIVLRVFKGDIVVVTHHKKPLAAVVPLEIVKLCLSAIADVDIDIEKIFGAK